MHWHRRRRLRPAVRGTLSALLLLLSAEAGAVIIAPGDGTGNTKPPSDDPGFANVGRAGGLTVVYLGNGWVATAHHVAVAPVELQDNRHEWVLRSRTRLGASEERPPDLALFKIYPIPDLPPLRIRATPPRSGELVVLIGAGRNRGEPTEWRRRRGWKQGRGKAVRWGTNHVLETGIEIEMGRRGATHAFTTDFSTVSPTRYECHVAPGDSGGAAFTRSGSSGGDGNSGWELAGILFGHSGYPTQPPGTVLFGNRALIGDLSRYRDEIEARIAAPACSDGLDDDADGRIDLEDPDCASADDQSE